MEIVKTRTAEIWMDESGIFNLKMFNEAEIDREDMADNLLVTRKLTSNKPVLRLIDLRTKWKMDYESELLFKKEDVPERTIARAILVNSAAEKVFKGFLVTLFKPVVPLKFFTSRAEAVKWLLSFKK